MDDDEGKVAVDDNSEFREAVDYFRSLVPMTDEEFAQLENAARQRAFRIAGVSQLDLVTQVWQALERAISEGTSFADFKSDVGQSLSDSWGAPDAARVETIFRTNVQTAYNAGRYAQQQHPAVKRYRPYLQYHAIEDSRTTEICEGLDNTLLPAENPFWSTHQPPLHFGCRSTVISLSEAETDEMGGIDDGAPDIQAAEGFGNPPSLTGWAPDLTAYPEPLAEEYRRKANG